jgi:hypothetical protein
VDSDTDLGGLAERFPPTRLSVLRATASADQAERKLAQQTLISAYWKPVYKYLRLHWKFYNEDAKDLCQGFFTLAIEKSFFEPFDPQKARFRTFLRICVDRYVEKEGRSAERLKRGGGVAVLALDYAAADGEIEQQDAFEIPQPDDYFRHEWLRDVFAHAVEGLRQQLTAAGKSQHFQIFQRYDLEASDAAPALTYQQLAAEFILTTFQVTNYLALARNHFRRLVLDRIRATTASDEEYDQELRSLFGGNAQ